MPNPPSLAREQTQSNLLVVVVSPAIVFFAAASFSHGQPAGLHVLLAILCIAFATAVWALRAATPLAACTGALVAFLCGLASPVSLVRSGLPPLGALFLLTFVTTRLTRKNSAAPALTGADIREETERRHGRSTSQVIANLGCAALLAGTFAVFGRPAYAPLLLLASLAEATADTVSSEVGRRFGGEPFLLTTLRRVTPGTDGAISVTGTLAGLGAAALVLLAALPSLTPRGTVAVFFASAAGLFFDSLLGATLEPRGYLGNDLVNFLSTVFAAAAAAGLLLVLG